MSYKLTRIKNALGHKIELFYNQNGYLNRMVDSVGRELDVITNTQGRITQVELREGTTRHLLVRYAYNPEQDLCTITDAVGADALLTYHNHLLTQTSHIKNGIRTLINQYFSSQISLPTVA